MIKLDKINKYFFKNKRNELHVIDNTSLELPDKGFETILGPSGSGKTTLLNVIGGLDSFDSGTLTIDDMQLTKKNYRKIESIRNTEIGYIFQDYKLLDNMSVFDNVAISLKMCGIKDKKEIETRVTEILNLLGIERYRHRKAVMLSGGERQRVSIARALVKDPRIVICDEPTGNLDSKRTFEIMNIIKGISKNRLVILVSHEEDIARFYSDRIIEIKDGKIIADYENETSDELNYEISNKIYLKDIKKKDTFKGKDVEINCYNDEDKKYKINLVIRNNNIYIETNGVSHVELINEDSSFELLDEHYKAIDRKTVDNNDFSIKPIPHKKMSSIYTIFTMLKNGWISLKESKRFKKLTISFAFLSAIFVFYAISVTIGALEVHKEDYLDIDEHYVRLMANQANNNLHEGYEALLERDDIIDLHQGTLIFSFAFKTATFYQVQASANNLYMTSVSNANLITEDDILVGRLPLNDKEIVVDISIFNNKAFKSTFRVSGIMEPEDLIGNQVYFDSVDLDLEIVGISNKLNNTMYLMKNCIDYMVIENNKSFGDASIYRDDEDINIIMGTYPTKLYDVLLPSELMESFGIGDAYNERYTVVGFYENNSIDEKVYITADTAKDIISYYNEYYTAIVKDKDKLKQDMGSYYKVYSVADENKEEYNLNRQDSIMSTFFSAGLLMFVTLVFVILMTRASFLSRIKEVGLLRAIGVSKSDIYRMFSGEVAIIIGIGGLAGVLVGYYGMKLLAESEVFDFGVYVSPWIALLVFLGIFIFYVIVVLIPVFFVLHKTPASILSRKDV